MIKQGGLLLRAGKTILILLLISAGFFCFGKNCWATIDDNIIINEICWMGAESASDEWIEFYNNGNLPINIKDWSIYGADTENCINFSDADGKITTIIPKFGYLIYANGEDNIKDINETNIVDIWDATIGMNNTSPGQIILYGVPNCQGDAIDIVNQTDKWIAGNNDTKQTMEKAIDGWQTSLNPGGTPKEQNSSGQEAPPEEEPEEEPTSSQPSPSEEDEEGEDDEIQDVPIVQYKLGDIVINEFVSDPADEDVEWIELYNITNKEINLNSWIIEEGSGAKTNLEGIIGSSNKSKFFVIEKPKGYLNNKGDIIILRDSSGILIDQVTYGSWDDGNTENNAPVASDPYSVARKFDGQNSYNNFNDFSITTTLTKGASNIITKTEEEQGLADEISAEEKALYDYSNGIIITEVFPNPIGSDLEDEFIELYNKSDQDVNLSGWKLGDESKRKYEIKTKNVIKADEYLVIYRSESRIALNNSSDSVKLYQPLKDEPLQVVKYKKAIEGWSYNLEFKGTKFPIGNLVPSSWVWSEIITPGAVNEIKTINHLPIVDFDCPEETLVGVPAIFDSSDTVDEDDDELKFFWDFGDGATNTLAIAEHTFFKQGAYTVKLIVSDGENEAEKEKIIRITSSLTSLLSNGKGINGSPSPYQGEGWGEVIINEFLPNPEGLDTEGEFIELYNQSNNNINLINWKVDDSERGSKPYNFDIDLWLNSGMHYLLDREESGLTLNNAADVVRLYNNFNELIEEIEYEQAIEGEAYARGKNNKWFWTTVITPGEENIISVADNNGSKVIVKSASYATNNKTKQIIETTLEKIHECEVGDIVKVAGVVAVKPGILGSQYFYIVGSAGIQVYNYKKDFPALSVGDYIEVQGELSMSSNELRLKTKTQEDFKILEHKEPPIAHEATCEIINEEYVGQLITVTGEVVERKSSIVYLDDGTDEVIVYIKKSTNINPKSIKEGETVAITGLVGQTKSGIRIMPRSSDDIIKKDPQSQVNEVGQVLGEISVSDEWEIAQRDKKIELFKYLLVIASSVIAVLGGLLIKGI